MADDNPMFRKREPPTWSPQPPPYEQQVDIYCDWMAEHGLLRFVFTDFDSALAWASQRREHWPHPPEPPAPPRPPPWR